MIGRQVGRYRIDAEVGRGGMGIVYRATQVTLDRTVAVKMLSEELASHGEYLARFRREAETLARLAHPNIVHIYDIEQSEGRHFIVMEYVDGPSLTDILAREGRLAPARARAITLAVASGLEAAHRKGIVHRDIKPDNILFTTDGRPKLTDFGIAHMRDSNVKTRTGVMLGTPYYMSPEQAGGRTVTAASDTYALSVVLYEMLSGRVPFSADTPVAVALKHLNEAPPPLEGRVPGLAPALARMVTRGLDKDPARRYATARALRNALTSVDLDGGTGRRESGSVGPGEDGSGVGDAERSAPGAEARSALDAALLAARDVAEDAGDAAARAVANARDAAAHVVERVGGGRRRDASAPEPESGADHGEPESRRVAAARRVALAGIGVGASRARDAVEGLRSVRLPTVGWIGLTLLGIGLIMATLTALFAGEDPTDGLTLGPGAPSLESSPSRGRAGGLIAGTGTRTTVFPRATDRGPGDDHDAPAADGRGPVPEDGASPADERTDSTDGGAGRNGPEGGGGPEPGGETPNAGAGSEGGSRGGSDAGSAGASGSAHAAARAEIEALVERQRVATETGDLALFLKDLAPPLREASERQFRRMQETAEEIRSRIGSVEISFSDAEHAAVILDVRLTAVRKRDDRRVVLHDGPVRWRLARTDGRWLITWTS